MRLLLLLHALLLLLASTDFTIVTAVLGQDSWRWSYFKYASQSGWGYEYVSDYTLLMVLTYIVAFAVGLVGFAVACLQGRWPIGMLGIVLSVLGLVSFGIEGSHWVWEHNRSWLAFPTKRPGRQAPVSEESPRAARPSPPHAALCEPTPPRVGPASESTWHWPAGISHARCDRQELRRSAFPSGLPAVGPGKCSAFATSRRCWLQLSSVR